jgi:NAD(P)-dependent dehydrogenase (short-subunit alcohol dehydrogenase family)
MTDQTERLAVVSGGTSGIGLAIARRLARDGFDLVVLGRDERRGREAARTLTDEGRKRAQFLALASEDFAAYPQLNEVLDGRAVHAVVAAAAIGWQTHALDTPVDQFADVLAVNVLGPLHLVQTLAPRLADGSAVVLVSSDAALLGEQATGAYSVSKAALNMLGRMLALDLAPRGVRVNVVCPGDIVPGMRYLLHPGQTARDPHEYQTWPVPPRGRLGEARDVAEMVSFLVSDRADFLVGSIITLDGGSRAGVRDPS